MGASSCLRKRRGTSWGAVGQTGRDPSPEVLKVLEIGVHWHNPNHLKLCVTLASGRGWEGEVRELAAGKSLPGRAWLEGNTGREKGSESLGSEGCLHFLAVTF